MAYASDDPGALAPEAGAAAPKRQLGPYWRRKLGQTLPGEMSAAQLRRVNMLRTALGLRPAGGAVGTNQGLQGNPVPGLVAGAAGDVGGLEPGMLQQYRQTLLSQLLPQHPAAEQPLDRAAQPMGPQDQNMAGNLEPPPNVREILLRRMMGAAPQLTSSAALHRVIGRTKPHQPILPARRPLPAAGRKLPY